MSDAKNTDWRAELRKYDKSVDKMYWFFLVFILVYELLGATPFLYYFTD